MIEIWLPVIGFERYRISNMGRVYSSISDRYLLFSDIGYLSVGLRKKWKKI